MVTGEVGETGGGGVVEGETGVERGRGGDFVVSIYLGVILSNRIVSIPCQSRSSLSVFYSIPAYCIGMWWHY